MFSKILKKLKGDRKYFAIVFFILLLIFLSGIITPIWVQYEKSNWNNELSEKILYIQNSVTALFQNRENDLQSTAAVLKSSLRKVLNPRNNSYGALIKVVNNKDFAGNSIEVLAPNGRLIAWSPQIAISQNDILPLAFPAGQIHFYNSPLITYLTVTDTVQSENDVFYFVVSVQFEKHYSLQNAYFRDVNFTKEISNKFLTQFEVSYTPFAERSRDGRKYSFELVNKQGNKIGLITFLKPTLTTAVDSIYQTIYRIQAVLALLAYLFIAFGFRKEFKALKTIWKIIAFAFYCILFRILLYYIGLPSNFFHGALVDPAYFSSTFGDGIVKSPVEFFVTALFVLIVCIRGFQYLIAYIHESAENKSKNLLLFSLLVLPFAFLFLLTLRGLGASVKSIIFDSTLRYFKEPNLIPNLPSLAMNLNLLMLGVSALLFLCSLILILISFLPKKNKNVLKYAFVGLFICFQFLGILFIHFENESLITPVLSIIFICLIFALTYQIYFGKLRNEFNYVFITIVASVISVSLLNYFNLQLEKESLKTTALEINRPNNNLLQFLLEETLENAANNTQLITDFYDFNSNYDAEAFKLWANSSLQRESLISSVRIWDKNQDKVGEFNGGIELGDKILKQFTNYTGRNPKIIETYQLNDTSEKVFTGIVPIYDRGIKLGYVSASIGFDIQNLGSNNIPDFLESKMNIINSVLDIKRLKIFEFADSKLTNVYGDIYPSRDQIKLILRTNFKQSNEAWTELSLNGVDYYGYLLKSIQDNVPIITVVLTREKRLTWDLFNFFKIFLVHSIFIVLLMIVLLAFRLKNLRYSFRLQLLIAFLLVSIIPIIILAVYNRQNVQQKSQNAIFNELNERTNYVERGIKEELKETGYDDFTKAFSNTGKDLGISFAIYEGTNLIYNSKAQYYNIGLFTEKLNPEVNYEVNYLSYREYLNEEKIDKFVYDSFYKKITIEGRSLIIGVNDAFNRVNLSFSVLSVDVFLFGVFSFTTLMMILLSAFLANKISLPIRKLTKATESVAQGDLSVELKNNVKGELRDLLNGFNLMTKELQKNQNELAELERENAWKEMAKQVAHEIKNPLTPMKLAVQQLIVSYRDKNKNFDSIFEKVSSTILNQIENLSLIASEFSRFARMPNFKLEKIDLLKSINDTINLFTDEQIKIELKTELKDAYIEADEGQMRRLFINLIRNSIQAESNKVEIDVDPEENNFRIYISDNGKGIPENIKDKIFDSSFTTKSKGMGLGLKLAKRFIEGINGSITLADNVAPGTVFKILIPRLKRNNQAKDQA